jgi:hypothetical protein
LRIEIEIKKMGFRSAGITEQLNLKLNLRRRRHNKQYSQNPSSDSSINSLASLLNLLLSSYDKGIPVASLPGGFGVVSLSRFIKIELNRIFSINYILDTSSIWILWVFGYKEFNARASNGSACGHVKLSMAEHILHQMIPLD